MTVEKDPKKRHYMLNDQFFDLNMKQAYNVFGDNSATRDEVVTLYKSLQRFQK